MNPNMNEFNEWVPKLVARLQQDPLLANVSSRPGGSRGLTVNLVIDRPTAGRFGITPATVDNALYDAFGQRIISTVYTQSNQYRVILEADPALQHTIDSLNTIYLAVQPVHHGAGAALGDREDPASKRGRCKSAILSQFPATTISLRRTAPGASLDVAVDSVTQGGDRRSNFPPRSSRRSRVRRRR